MQSTTADKKNNNVVMVTRHGKGELIAPTLNLIGFNVTESRDFNTDQLGTFSGEIERRLSPLDCAREKAKQACQLSDATWGLGSEGSFGGGPAPGFMNWDEEILVLLSADRSVELVARAQGPIQLVDCNLPSEKTQAENKIRAHIEKYSSEQGWILVGADEPQKALIGADAVISAYEKNIERRVASLKLIPDLRAHLCPERQVYIKKAAQELAALWLSRCPQCDTPGFNVTEVERGLPCELCSAATNQVMSKTSTCTRCHYRTTITVEREFADPQFCNWCNP